jgi:xanthine dehydrogenase accessory factor
MNIYSKIDEIEASGHIAVLCIVTKTRGSTPRHAGSKMIVFPDGKIFGTVGGGEIESLCISESLKLIENGYTANLNYKLVNPEQGDPGICGGEVDIYLEVIGKKANLLIIGAGHVGQKLAHLGNWLGFSVGVIDDRKELLETSIIVNSSSIFPSLEEYKSKTTPLLPNNLFVVFTTRSLDIDVSLIPEILTFNPKYIGVIGSNKRWLKTTELLLNDGILESDIEQIYSPIGLDLQSETPEEIALSIMAEILIIKNNATGSNLKLTRRKKIDVE